MKYAYNINVNFRSELINFYEWEKSDKITLLKKVPLIKVTDEFFADIINKNISLKKEDLNEMKIENQYICVFASEYDTVCIKFNDKGEVKKISKLTLEDELEILDYTFKIKTTYLDYNIISKNQISYSNLTRNEKNIINSIIKELEKVKDNEDIIKYLYYEWFDENGSTSFSYNKLIDDISKNFSHHHEEFYKLIKILNYKNA